MKKPFSTPLLYVTAGISGALVMVVEILGARIISPFFGVSLFIWTALISVTLLALAAGYIVGGRLADRFPTAQGLFGLIAGAGSWLILIPSIKAPIVELALMLGLRAGAFFSALALFGPALFMLGCVSPWLMRLLASSIDRIGATSGRLYGLSTVGSFVGSALTGFYLLGEVGVNLALYASGGILSTLALLHFAYVRDPRGWLVLLGLSPLLWSPLRSPSHIGAVLEDGTTATLISVKDSYHGSVRVVDYSMNRNGTREMIIDGLVQGGVDRSSGLSIYEYSYMLEHLPLSIRPQGKSCLTIGLGAGIAQSCGARHRHRCRRDQSRRARSGDRAFRLSDPDTGHARRRQDVYCASRPSLRLYPHGRVYRRHDSGLSAFARSPATAQTQTHGGRRGGA